MADLDDFFAKKDKKKSKSKPKFLTAEDLVKNLEDTSKREAAALKSKKPELVSAPVFNNTAGASGDEITAATKPQSQVNEEEWGELPEEQRKDYSGLKLGQLTVNDEDEDSSEEGDEEDLDSEGYTGSDSGKLTGGGPWKKVIPADQVTQIPMDMPKAPKAYVAPGLKQSQVIAATRLKLKSKTAPDITNAEYFPTLGAARPEEQRKKKNEPAFEEVRHGGRMQHVQPISSAPSAAVNRFQTLADDDS